MKKIISSLIAATCCWVSVATAQGQATEGNPRDVLVFRNGDRVQGHLVEKVGDILVFQSDRFGEVRVPAGEAVVIKAEPPVAAAAHPPAATPAAKAAQVEKKAAEHAEAERVSGWERFSPAVLTAKLRDYFGPWHGKLAVSSEVVSDTTDRNNFSAETQLKRKWKADEVQLNGHYDYSETSGIPTTDMLKADGSWRHDFTANEFLQYRPSVEWNRANFRDGVPADYVLLQQEIGAGLNVLTTPAHKLRFGVSENLFDTWTLSPPTARTSRTVESAFAETELKMKWGLLLTDRTVYYYSLSTESDGWENRIELTKKFTETFSTGIRHELRRGSPDGTAQDYTRLKLFLGVDF